MTKRCWIGLKGAIRFEITDREIQDALLDQDIEVVEPDDIEVPDDLISNEDVENLIGTCCFQQQLVFSYGQK